MSEDYQPLLFSGLSLDRSHLDFDFLKVVVSVM